MRRERWSEGRVRASSYGSQRKAFPGTVAPSTQAPAVVIAPLVLVAALSASQVMWQLAGANAAFTDAPGWVTAVRGGAFLLLLALIATHLMRVKQTTLVSESNAVLAGMLAAAAAAFTGGIVREGSAPSAMSYLGYVMLAMLFLAARRSPEAALFGASTALRWICIASLALVFLDGDLAFSSSIRRYPFFGLNERMAGVVGDPNILGMLGGLLVAISLSSSSVRKRVDLPVALSTAVLAESRTALLAIFICYCFWLVRGSRLGLLSIYVTSVIGCLLTVAYGLTTTLDASIASGRDLLNSRPLIWDWSVLVWRGSPVWGHGPGIFEHSSDVHGGIYWVHAHNELLQALVTGGIIRAAAILLLLTAIVALGGKSTKGHKWLPAALSISLITQCVTEIPLYINSVDFRFATMVIFVLAFSAATTRQANAGRVLGNGAIKPDPASRNM